MQQYAELEENLIELRNQSRIEVTSFLDDEIGCILDKLSRQVARIDTRLFTSHEVASYYEAYLYGSVIIFFHIAKDTLIKISLRPSPVAHTVFEIPII